MIFFLGFIAARLVRKPKQINERTPRADASETPDLVELELGAAPVLAEVTDEKLADELAALTVRRNDPVAAYLAEARRYPLLDRDEEHELALKYRDTADPAAARRLVTANLRLVVKIANEYRRVHRQGQLIDLVGEGNVGLMQAVPRYDPDRGARFSTYAAWWIRAYILKFILDNWRMVRIGTTQAQRKLFFRLKKEKDILERLGVAPEHRLLAQRMDVTEDEVAEMELRLASPEVSLDAPVARHEPDGATRGELLPAPGDGQPDAIVEQAEFRAALRERLERFAARLRGREQAIFTARWLRDEPRTLQEVGDEHGISRERTRQIEKRLLERLRAYLEAELGSAVEIRAAA